jgi:hypothetical protein
MAAMLALMVVVAGGKESSSLEIAKEREMRGKKSARILDSIMTATRKGVYRGPGSQARGIASARIYLFHRLVQEDVH